MGLEAMMKVSDLGKRLRVRLGKLKRARVVELAAYDKAFSAWRRDVSRWLATEGAERAKTIAKGDVQSHYRGGGGLPDSLFRGMPRTPAFPSNDTIASIQKTLRFFALSKVAELQVTRRDLDEWFGEEGLEE